MNRFNQRINMVCEPDIPGIYFDDELSSDLVPQSISNSNRRGSQQHTFDNQNLPRRTYKCTVCNKMLRGSTQLLDHVRTHTRENLYLCKYCNRSFKETSSLNLHVKKHNLESSSKRFNSMRCCVCEVIFPDPDMLRIHEKNHTPEAPFRCRYCSSIFSLIKQFKIHINRHLIQIQRKKMIPKYIFEDHLRNHQESITTPSNFTQPQRRLQCSLCHKVFAKSYNLKRHLIVHQKYGHDQNNYSNCSPTSSNSNNSENFNIPTELEVVKISNKRTQMLNRSSKEPTSLTLTPALLSNLNKLTNHINSTEPNLGLKKPPILININTSNPAKAAILSNIKQEVPGVWHTRKNPDLIINPVSKDTKNSGDSLNNNAVSSISSNSHEDQLVNHGKKQIPLSSIQCLLCNKVLSEPFSLKVHMRTHTGERPFSCFCGKSFSQSCNLNTHARTHSSLKLFNCTFCEKSFTRASSLKGHLVTHTNQKHFCQQCNISFENDVHAYSQHMHTKHQKATDLMQEEIRKISEAMKALKDQQTKGLNKAIEVDQTHVENTVKTEKMMKEAPRLMEVFEVQQSNGAPNGKIPKLKITIKKEPLNQKSNNSNIGTVEEIADKGNESDSSSSSSSSSSSTSSSSSSSGSLSSASDNKNSSNKSQCQPIA